MATVAHTMPLIERTLPGSAPALSYSITPLGPGMLTVHHWLSPPCWDSLCTQKRLSVLPLAIRKAFVRPSSQQNPRLLAPSRIPANKFPASSQINRRLQIKATSKRVVCPVPGGVGTCRPLEGVRKNYPFIACFATGQPFFWGFDFCLFKQNTSRRNFCFPMGKPAPLFLFEKSCVFSSSFAKALLSAPGRTREVSWIQRQSKTTCQEALGRSL